MTYQPYTKRIRTIRAKADVGPQVVITKSGVLNLNVPAQRALNAEFVILGYDPETSRVALIPASEDVPHAVPIRRVPGSHQRQVSGRGFLSVNKISREQARRFRAEVDGEGNLVFRVEGRKKAA